mgnify:CR=1 FL=1
MKPLKFSFTCFLLSALFFACEKESSQKESQLTPKYYITDINGTQNTFLSIWDSVYQTYPMSVFCNCDCTTSSVIQNEVNSRIVNFENFEDFSPWDFTCEEFMNGIGGTCGKEIAFTDSLLTSKLSEMLSIRLISQEEYSILNSLFNEIVTAPMSIDFQQYNQDWENIDFQESPSNGMIPYAIIEYSRLATEYFTDFPNPTLDGPTFLIHKVAGGCFGAIWNITWEVTVGNGIHSGKEYWKTAAGGFIGGAIGSL